ncbi:MAG: recombinase family protein, partial [Bradyrhizobium sp.]
MAFEMKSAAIYARFSTELQSEKSTEDQIALCRAYAARHQLNVVATFEDKARSGASVFGRDGLMQLMDAARQNLFTVVIVEALGDAIEQELLDSYYDCAQRMLDLFDRASDFSDRVHRELPPPPPDVTTFRHFERSVDRLLNDVVLV